MLLRAVVHGAIELYDTLNGKEKQLEVMFELLHGEMMSFPDLNGRREPYFALEYWKSLNDSLGLVGRGPFNMVAHASITAQASSAYGDSVFRTWHAGKVINVTINLPVHSK